jgi:hypothetical protein
MFYWIICDIYEQKGYEAQKLVVFSRSADRVFSVIGFSPRLYIKFALSSGNDDDAMGEVDPEQLKDWPPNLTKLSVYFDDNALTQHLRVTSSIASSLPRTLTSLNLGISFFDNPNVLQEMPPKLIECSTTIGEDLELISASIPLLPKSLTTIHVKYLLVPSLWKYLPRTITSIEDMAWQPIFNSETSPFIQDLPPLLNSLQSCISFFQPSFPVMKNITRLSIRFKLADLHPQFKFFFNIISTQLPHLEWLDLGWNGFVDGSLLDILQQPLKTLQLTCDPCTLNFISGKWSKSLQFLHVRAPDDFKSNHVDIHTFIKQRDPNWRLPTTLTSLSSHHALAFLSPSSPQHWPPNLTQIKISNLDLNNSTILWTSLPPTLLKLEFRVENGEIDLLSHPDFIDSLKYLPPGITSFRLVHPLHRSSRSPNRESKGKFCFPKSILDLATTHPKLAFIKICNNELDLSRSDCKP